MLPQAFALAVTVVCRTKIVLINQVAQAACAHATRFPRDNLELAVPEKTSANQTKTASIWALMTENIAQFAHSRRRV